MSNTQGRVLIIAGSDSGGGAGVQGDIKTVTALGGYAMSAITAVTVQNTLGVFGVHQIPGNIVRDQIRVVMEDLGADAIKTGMLGSAETVEVVAEALASYAVNVPTIVDPVMIAKGGAELLADAAIDAVKTLLLSRAALITPNAPEATRLTGIEIENVEDQQRAGDALIALGANAVLVKGGHVPGAWINDVLVTREGLQVFTSQRIATRATHGTGCALASAIAAGMAQGMALAHAVEWGRLYLLQAIAAAPGIGHGHQPLGHNWPLRQD